MAAVYETQRLVLRVLDSSHAEMAADYLTRNRAFMEEWESTKADSYYTKEYQETSLEKEAAEADAGRSFRLWIFKKGEEDRIIGTVGFSNIIKGAFWSCHLGYKLDKDEINNGYITEAIQKGIEIVFGEFGLHRIEANIMPRNKPFLRVAEKLGFYNEGLAKKYLKINGVWEDHIHMVLLNENSALFT